MTTTVRTSRDTERFGYPSPQPAEVVAVLLHDGFALAVASVAVAEAVQRQAPVRFLQVVTSCDDEEGPSLAEEATFRAGLRALHGHPRTHSVFEVVRGRASAVVRTRSRGAALVVVGIDDHQDAAGRGSLADQCLSVACCPVRTVAVPG